MSLLSEADHEEQEDFEGFLSFLIIAFFVALYSRPLTAMKAEDC